MIQIEIHQKDNCGLYCVWYTSTDIFSRNTCVVLDDADIERMLSSAQYERFLNGDWDFKVRFVPASLGKRANIT